jgi:hypothetical protein
MIWPKNQRPLEAQRNRGMRPMNPALEPHMSPQSTSNDLKAQEDLLALKILGDPQFLDRVPYLMPVDEMLSKNLAQHPQLSSSEVPPELVHALSEQVKRRVLAELDLILPELISSCLGEVLSESSKGEES